MKDLHLDYYDNYMAMGITPQFKRYNSSDFGNQTRLFDNSNINGPINNYAKKFDKKDDIKNKLWFEKGSVQQMLEKVLSSNPIINQALSQFNE